MAEFSGFFIHGYSTGVAAAALGAKLKPLEVDVTVVSDRFTDHKKYGTDERDGKRLLVMADTAPRPFEVQLPLADEDGEELSFSNCHLKKLGRARLTGVEAYLSTQRQSISFRAKSIEGVTTDAKK